MAAKRVYGFLKREIVLLTACTAALISAFFVRPSVKYIEYINFSVLALLFCLMLIVAGFIKSKLFDIIASKILRTTRDIKIVSIFLVTITFFSAMLVTNDVSLLTFVPLTIGLFGAKHENILIFVIVMETIAANLGSMMTPIGNPQNLYLYSFYNLNIIEFFKIILPIGLFSCLLIIFALAFEKSEQINLIENSTPHIENKFNFIIYTLLFVLCILTVLRVIDYRICLAVSVVLIFIIDKKLFRNVDYSLLFTFVAFFVFVGNLCNIEIFKNISAYINGKELVFGILFSQIISNVPAAIMLSGFTQNAKELLVGVNIGGLGTIIASLASLISFKLYAKSENANAKKYLIVFTVLNFGYLIILTGVYLIFTQ